MDSQVLFTKNDNGTIEPILGLNASTILTTTKNLSQLSDVDTTNAGAQRVLTYNATTGKWEPVLPSIAGLSDVLFSDLQASNVIKWSPTPVNKWVNRDLGFAIMTIQGQIKDSVINTENVEWNILNPANYETGTFTITPFSNNSINIDTTTNFQVDNLVVGANYRIEWNFNYSILTAVSTNLHTFTIRNQANTSLFGSSNQITTGMKTFVSSLSGTNATSSGYKFTIDRNALSNGSIIGQTSLNLNCVISVIEM